MSKRRGYGHDLMNPIQRVLDNHFILVALGIVQIEILARADP